MAFDRVRQCSVAFLVFCLGLATTAFADGRFSSLTYNVAGLLEPFSSSNPAKNTPIISCKIRGYTLVNVQEDFNYHAALYDTCDDHPFRTSTTGGMGIGSGLNSLSYLPYQDLSRVRWKACNGVDCLTPKGWTVIRVRLEEGAYLSVYNLHAQAQTETKDLEARRSNMLQLLAAIEAQSNGDAILVMGDTNTRYTRAGDNIGEFLKHGFRDVWLDKIRNGDVPKRGDPPLTACENLNSPTCEVVDKVLYRSSRNVQLRPESFLIDKVRFVNEAGEPLSDHYPIAVQWSYKIAAAWKSSDRWGGPHGDFFNDLNVIPVDSKIQKLTVQAGNRLDRIEAQLTSGVVLSHGGSGGTARSVTLGSDDDWIAVELCSIAVSGHTRIAYAKFFSRRGQLLEGGKRSSDCTRYAAPEGYHMTGFHGRSGDEVDSLGLIYSPRSERVASPLPYQQFVNQQSQLCLDFNPQAITPGADVQQWTCNGGAWQKWAYEASTGLIRNQYDSNYCLDNGSNFSDGSTLKIWPCMGNANQQFSIDAASGAVMMRSFPNQVLDGFGTSPGSEILTYSDWGGLNQRWNFLD